MSRHPASPHEPATDQLELDALRQRLQLLEQIGALLASSLDYGRTLGEVARLAVPSLADWCAVDILDSGGVLRRLAAAHVEPTLEPDIFELAERVRLAASHPDSRVNRAMLGDEPQLLPAQFFDQIREQVVDPVALALVERLAPVSGIVVGIRARGRALGALLLMRGAGSPTYTEPDLLLAREIADRGALAIDNALLHAEAGQRCVSATSCSPRSRTT